MFKHYLLISAWVLIALSGCSKEDLSPGQNTDGFQARSGGYTNQPPPADGVLTAGEWNDLENWPYWLDSIPALVAQQSLYWGIYPMPRVAVDVRVTPQEPWVDVPVELLHNGVVVWKTRTDAHGRAELWPNLFTINTVDDPATLGLRVNGLEPGIAIIEDIVNEVEPSNPLNGSVPSNVDIAFVVDATQSMGQELVFLQEELPGMLYGIRDAYPGLTLRTGSVFYRDRGEEYLTRTGDFSDDIATTVDFIRAQEAKGGGDYPEAVERGLLRALDRLEWSPSARARLLFLLLDAPPRHANEVIADYHRAVALAGEKGVKIIPVVAQGVDQSTEFLLRFTAMATNGTYVFITGTSSIGPLAARPAVGNYQEEALRDLLIRLIEQNID
jgi:hypothetical protein